MSQVVRQVTVANKMGIHARPSTQIATLAGDFTAAITIAKEELSVDAKSVLELLMLAAECGSELIISADGDDAQAAVDAIVELVEARFEELDVDG